MAPRAQVTPVALAVLELLHERPMHPYEMHQTMRIRHTDRIVKLNAGTLYHTVERLGRHGLVEVAETSRAGRRPERTVYALTPAGKEVFAQRVVDMLANPAEEYPEYAHAVALAHTVDREAVLTELRLRQSELETLLATDQEGVERLERIELPRRFWLDVTYLRAMRTAELAWTTDLIREIETGDLPWPGPGSDTAPDQQNPHDQHRKGVTR